MRWPALALAVFLAAAVAWLSTDPELKKHAYGKGSSLSTAPAGLSLARAYLAEHEHAKVASLARPLSRAALPADAVVLRIQPRRFEAWRSRRRPDGGPADAGAAAAHSGDGGAVDAGSDAAHAKDGGALDGGSVTARVPDGGALDGGAAAAPALDGGTAAARGGEGARADRDADDDDEEDDRDASGPPDPEERRAALLSDEEEAFVRRGGRLVIAADEDHGPLFVHPTDPGDLEKVFPALPGVAALESEGRRGLRGPGLVDAVTVFVRSGLPAVARRALGSGDVWLLANPELFDNQLLGSGDHLKLLVALAGGGRPVFFDEWAHGQVDDASATELLVRWGLGPACLLAAMAGVAWFWRRAVPLGAPSPYRDLRTESVDLAYAIGALYGRTLKARDQLALHHARLVHEIEHRLGLKAEAAEAKARELAPTFSLPAEGKRVPRAEYDSLLAQLNDALRRVNDGHRKRTR